MAGYSFHVRFITTLYTFRWPPTKICDEPSSGWSKRDFSQFWVITLRDHSNLRVHPNLGDTTHFRSNLSDWAATWLCFLYVSWQKAVSVTIKGICCLISYSVCDGTDQLGQDGDLYNNFNKTGPIDRRYIRHRHSNLIIHIVNYRTHIGLSRALCDIPLSFL